MSEEVWIALTIGVVIGGALDHYLLPSLVRLGIRLMRFRDGK